MLLLWIPALLAAAPVSLTVPRLAKMPCEEGTWEVRSSGVPLLTGEPGGPQVYLRCRQQRCIQEPVADLGGRLLAPEGAAEGAEVTAWYHCPEEFSLLWVALWPEPGVISASYALPEGPILAPLDSDTIMAVPWKQPLSASEGARLVAAVLAAGRAALAQCVESGCQPRVPRVLAGVPSQGLVFIEQRERMDWVPAENPSSDRGWTLRYAAGGDTLELGCSVFDATTEGLSVRVLRGGQPHATVTLGAFYGGDVTVSWDTGKVTLGASGTGRAVSLYGDAVPAP